MICNTLLINCLLFTRMASRVLLSTLAIPVPVSLSETERHLELDENARDKSRRLALLLGLQSTPTRATLIADMVMPSFLAKDSKMCLLVFSHHIGILRGMVSPYSAFKTLAKHFPEYLTHRHKYWRPCLPLFILLRNNVYV